MPRHLSWGFVPLQRIWEKRVHVRAGQGSASRLSGVSADGSQSVDYGAARRFSRPLSDLFLSSPSRRFSGGWHSWGSPFRGLILAAKLRRLVAAELPS
jgi:hypothetical protein